MRALNAATLAALSDPTVRWLVLVRLHFDGGVIAWHNGFAPLNFDGYDYAGAAHLGSISAVSETASPKPNKLTVGISGIDPAVVALLLAEEALGRPAYVHLATCDDAWQIVGEPILWFYGQMDPPTGNQGKTGSFAVTINSRLADWSRPLVERYTHVDQIARFPGDLGLEFAEQVAANGLIGGD